MFETLRCAWKGHLFVDSRSRPGTQVCLRCHQRRPFEGLAHDHPGSDKDR